MAVGSTADDGSPGESIPNHPKGGFDGAVYAVGEHVEGPSGLSETWAVNGWVSTAD